MAHSYEGLDDVQLRSVERVLRWMHNLTDQQRASVFEAMADNFCPFCGQHQPTNGDLCECADEEERR